MLFNEKVQEKESDQEKALKREIFQDCIDFMTKTPSRIVIDKIDEDFVVYKQAQKKLKKCLKKWIELQSDGVYIETVLIDGVEYIGGSDADKLYNFVKQSLKKQQERISAQHKKKMAQKQQPLNNIVQNTR